MHLRPLFLLLMTAPFALASSGDRAHDFELCTARCQNAECNADAPPEFSLPMRLTRWTCADNCKYTCMHMLTDFALETGVPIQQYYGKWPFYRFLGMQEPASVLFSFTNLLVHIWGLGEVKRVVPAEHPMRGYYVTWSFVSCNAWIWSAVFHTRDTPATERLDYFSAAATIVYSLYFSVIRLFHLYPVQSRAFAAPSDAHSRRRTWRYLATLAYIAHVTYLTVLPRFDYTYNIIFNLALGLLHNFLWLGFAMPSSLSPFRRFASMPKAYRPSYAKDAAIAVALTTLATSLELFDFPPWWGIIDAHSLWHLATAPLAVIWYDFLVTDAQDLGWKAVRL